jgi:outer membrane scaffolding protein for murein synthesis (MipA/OmpV family)
VLAALLALAPHAASAWGNLLLLDPPPQQATWSAGASLWRIPAFPGASHLHDTLLPAFEWRDAQGRFVSTDSGVGWNLSQRKDTQFGLRVWPQLGRRSSDAPRGVGAVGPRLQAQAFANHAPHEALLLQSGLLIGGGQHRDGVQMELGLTSGLPIGADLLGLGLSANWANAAYRNSTFGISPTQSAASGLPAYAPGAGWTDRCLTLSFEHRFSTSWRFDIQAFKVWFGSRITASPLGLSRSSMAATATLWRDF